MSQSNLTARCECGVVLTGNGEDELVDQVLAHVAESHPSVVVTRDQILAMAESAVPDEPTR